MRAVHAKCSMAERVGFEPTVPLPGRMLSKHVDSSTLAPLRVEKYKGEHLSMRVHDQQGEQVMQFCWSWAHLSRCDIEEQWDEVPSVVWVDTYMGPTVQSYTTLPIFAVSLRG